MNCTKQSFSLCGSVCHKFSKCSISVHDASQMVCVKQVLQVTNVRGRTGSLSASVEGQRSRKYGRRHEPVPVIGQWLSRLFRGYCNYYYHVLGNRRRLDTFHREIISAWRHALKWRNQRHHLNWERMTALARLFIPNPRELPMLTYPITRFGVKTQGRSRIR